jgi:hypothetical protein
MLNWILIGRLNKNKYSTITKDTSQEINLVDFFQKFMGPSIGLAAGDEIDWRVIWKGLKSCLVDSESRVNAEKFTIYPTVFEMVIHVSWKDQF